MLDDLVTNGLILGYIRDYLTTFQPGVSASHMLNWSTGLSMPLSIYI